MGIFGGFNQKMYFNQPKFVWFKEIFIDIVESRKWTLVP